jgi:hypothetical protein
MFTWIPIHQEAIHRILEHRDNQQELLTILQEMKQQDCNVVLLDDKGPDGQRIPLAEIDPFTFLASFNRSMKPEKRQRNWAVLKARWDLKASVPNDFAGIPVMHPTSSWFFPYAVEREKEHVAFLWQVAARAVDSDVENLPGELFDRCLRLKQVAIATSQWACIGSIQESFSHPTTRRRLTASPRASRPSRRIIGPTVNG